jgi:MFS transporter, DHA1 family, multidrug resistance protein
MLTDQLISASVRRRGLVTLLVDTFLMWAGFFMIIPLLSLYYVDRLGWAAASIGLVLAVRQFTQQGLTPISGVLADRLGTKGLICTGLLLRTLGFASMAWADTFPLLLLSAALSAVGGSMFESPKSAAVAALTDDTNRGRYYALTGVVSQIGLTLGTQAGALLLGFDFSLVALVGAGCFLLTFLVTLVFMPSVKVATESANLTDGLRLALHDKPFLAYNALLMGFWFLWVQLAISLPLAAKTVGGGPETVGWIYAINSGLSIALQYPLLRLASKWLRPLPILIAGVLLMAVGLGGIALMESVPGLLACSALFALGSLLAMPSQQTVTADLANPAALGSYFGVSSLALAIGGGLGNLSGGLLYDLGKGMLLPELPWLVFFLVGGAAAIGLSLLALRQKPLPTPQIATAEISAALGDAAK